jgi:hypothetical protein
MATYAILGDTKAIARGVYETTWLATVSGVGNPLNCSRLSEHTVQCVGPTGGTSRIIIRGSNAADASSATAVWNVLSTPTDGNLDFTNVTGGLVKVVLETPRSIQPQFETVTTGKTLSVIIVSR